MFENFDTNRDSSKRRKEDRIFTYKVPDVVVVEECEDPEKELFEEENIDLVRKINFMEFAAAEMSEEHAAAEDVSR